MVLALPGSKFVQKIHIIDLLNVFLLLYSHAHVTLPFHQMYVTILILATHDQNIIG